MAEISKSVRTFLSQSWIGPTISLVVLGVSVTSAIFTISTFVRQGNRFEIEDERLAPRVGFIVEVLNAKDGWMRGVIDAQNRRDIDLTIHSIDVVSPGDMRLAKCDCETPEGKPMPTTMSNRLTFENESIDAARPNNFAGWGKVVWVKAADPRRRGLVIRFNFRENYYPFRLISRSAAARVYNGMPPKD